MLMTVEKITGKNLLVYTCIHLLLPQINKAYLTGVMGGPSGSSFLGDDRLLWLRGKRSSWAQYVLVIGPKLQSSEI